MNICVAGWYLEQFKDFYEQLKQTECEVFIVSNRKSDFLKKLNLPYCVRENTGLEWGAYNHYLMKVWEGGDTLFCHDDIVLNEPIKPIETDYDQAYIFNNGAEYIENAGMHGRMVFMSDSFMQEVKKRGGFYYDKFNKGYTNPDDLELKREFGCSYYNAGIRCFYDMASEIGGKVNEKIFLDSFFLCKRGDRDMDKYDPKGSFQDPILRCFRCHTVLKAEQLLRLGVCSKCGGRKVSNVTILSEEELETIKKWDLDPEYIAEWGAVDE